MTWRSCANGSSPRCAAGSRRTTRRCRSPRARSPTTPATARAGSTPWSAASRAGGGPEEILLDGDKEGEGFPFFDLGDAESSPDHRFLAWSADRKGSEYFTVRIRDLATGEDLPEAIPATADQVVWAGDSRSLYYVELDRNHRPARVRRHRLGTPAADDELIHEETTPGWFIDIDVTSSRSFMTVSVGDHETSEVWLVDRSDPDATPRLVAARRPFVRYEVEHHGADLVILTNDAGAEDFKIVTTPLARPEHDNWRDLIPHRPGVMILFHMVLARHLVRLEREDAKPRIVVREIWTAQEHAIEFAEDAYSLGLSPGREFDTDVIRLNYSSMTTPIEIYDYDMHTRARILRKRQEVPSGHDPADYVTRRLFATAHDGEQVPISILHRKDLGARRLRALPSLRLWLLRHLDGRGVPHQPALAGRSRLRLRHRPHPRRHGKRLGLVRQRQAREQAEHVQGLHRLRRGAGGGALHGARAHRRLRRQRRRHADGRGRQHGPGPVRGHRRRRAVRRRAPHHARRRPPLTPPEWPEWGNPGTDEAAFRTILSYAPYENVRPQRYPAILALGGLTDPRVTYWEPAKWVARLRATMTGGGPVLLNINMEAGHGGAAGRFDRLEEVALIYAFAIKAVEGGFEELAAEDQPATAA